MAERTYDSADLTFEANKARAEGVKVGYQQAVEEIRRWAAASAALHRAAADLATHYDTPDAQTARVKANHYEWLANGLTGPDCIAWLGDPDELERRADEMRAAIPAAAE